ncbi:hypothetical protein [Glycomyces tarimensis]
MSTHAPWWVAGDRLTTAAPAARQARFAYKPAATTRTSATATDDPDLLLSLPAGMWQLSARLFYGATTGSKGIKVGWGFTVPPTGVQPERIGFGPTSTSTNRINTNVQTRGTAVTSTAIASPTPARLYGNDDGLTSYAVIIEDGLFSLALETTWSITWAEHTVHADGTQLGAGSWIKARPIVLLEAT